jgi:hypothetical protein
VVHDRAKPSQPSTTVFLPKWTVSRRYMPVEKLTDVCNDPDTATMIAAQ